MKSTRMTSLAELDAQVFRWNSGYAVGTTVAYYPVTGRDYNRTRKTRSPAFVLSGHTACVFLEGEAGCVALDNCQPVEEGAA